MSEVVISAPGIGVGCRTTPASVSESWAAAAAHGAAAAKPAAAAAWKKSRRSQPEVLLLRIGPVQSIDLSPTPVNSMVSSRFNRIREEIVWPASRQASLSTAPQNASQVDRRRVSSVQRWHKARLLLGAAFAARQRTTNAILHFQ